jgi:hypothetical protein
MVLDYGQVEIVHQMGLLGVNIEDVLDDDFNAGGCGSTEFPLVQTINYALRNNMSRPRFNSARKPGIHLFNTKKIPTDIVPDDKFSFVEWDYGQYIL